LSSPSLVGPAHALAGLLAAMTSHGWQPGPGDPTLAGWVIFAGYLAVALLAWRAARREATRGMDPFLWRALAIVCALLALNKQLDLSNAVTAYGRQVARTGGWYEQRRVAQLGLLAGLALGGGAALVWAFRRQGAEWRRHRLTWAGLVFLVTFAGVRAVSFHYVDAVLRLGAGDFRLNAMIELAAIGLLLLSAVRAARAP
jgi:hypothetical protein